MSLVCLMYLEDGGIATFMSQDLIEKSLIYFLLPHENGGDVKNSVDGLGQQIKYGLYFFWIPKILSLGHFSLWQAMQETDRTFMLEGICN